MTIISAMSTPRVFAPINNHFSLCSICDISSLLSVIPVQSGELYRLEAETFRDLKARNQMLQLAAICDRLAINNVMF
jgi:hypothetical protein